MSLRTRLILLWAGFLLLSGALFAELLRERAEAERDAGRLVQGYARLLAEHTAGTIRNAELAAQGLAAHPDVQRALADARREAASTRQPGGPDLEPLMRAIPGAINIYVADHHGRVLSSAMALPHDTRINGRDYFRRLADGHGPLATVSGTLRGHASGKWAIQVARRIEDRDGRFLGIVGVSLGIEEAFSRFYRSVDFPAQATISLWNDAQLLLMRYPMDTPGAQHAATANLLATLPATERREALHSGRAGVDGQTQLIAIRELQSDPILSVVTLPEEAYLKAWRASARTASTVTLALLAACAVLTLRLRQQQQAAAALSHESGLRAEQLEAYGRIVETAPVALALVDAELRCVIMNSAFAGLLGREAPALAGQPLTELLADPAWAPLHQDVRAALDGRSRRRTLQLPLTAVERHFDVEVTPFLRNWRPAGAVLSLRDVTVQRLAEEALQRREAELKAIFEGGPECIKLIGRDGRIQRINRAGLAILEADDLEHGLATQLEALVDPADRAAFIDFNRRVMQGEGGTLQYRGVGLKGTPRWVETHAVPMRDSQGAITGALAVTRDISAIHHTGARLPGTLARQRAEHLAASLDDVLSTPTTPDLPAPTSAPRNRS